MSWAKPLDNSHEPLRPHPSHLVFTDSGCSNKGTAAAQLRCYSVHGGALTVGDTYVWHQAVRYGGMSGATYIHHHWLGEVFFVGADPNHIVIWTNVPFAQIRENSFCSFHL